jgi:hypothetical protein
MRRFPIAAAGAVSLLFLATCTMAAGTPPTWIGADAYSMDALLVDIKPGGPAEAAGLKADDVIYRFDNKGVSSMGGLFELVHATPPGKGVEVYVLRGDEVLHVDRRLEALPGAREPEGPVPDSVPLVAHPKACTPEFRALAGRC